MLLFRSSTRRAFVWGSGFGIGTAVVFTGNVSAITAVPSTASRFMLSPILGS